MGVFEEAVSGTPGVAVDRQQDRSKKLGTEMRPKPPCAVLWAAENPRLIDESTDDAVIHRRYFVGFVDVCA